MKRDSVIGFPRGQKSYKKEGPPGGETKKTKKKTFFRDKKVLMAETAGVTAFM